MAARQRLRVAFDARRASQPCWRCALNLPRYSSTSQAGMLHNSKSMEEVPYSETRQQAIQDSIKSPFPNISPLDVELAQWGSNGSESGPSPVVDKPRVQVRERSRSGPLGARAQTGPGQAVRRLPGPGMSDGRRVDNRSRSQSGQTVRKPRIRVMSDGRPVALGTQSPSSAVQAVGAPRIRVMSGGRPVALGTRSQSQRVEARQESRTRVSSEGQLLPLETRTFLSSERTNTSESKHDLDPVIRKFTKPPLLEDASGTRKSLRFRKSVASQLKHDLDPVVRKHATRLLRSRRYQASKSKHELDPIIRNDTKGSLLEDTSTRGLEIDVGGELSADKNQGNSKAMSLTVSKVYGKDGRPLWDPSDVAGNNTTYDNMSQPVKGNSQTAKHFRIDIERFKSFIKEKFEARVRFHKNSIIKKYRKILWEPRDVAGHSTRYDNMSQPAKGKPQISKHFTIDIERFQNFMHESFGGRVLRIEDSIIKKYLFGNGSPNIHYISNYVNDARIIRQVPHDSRQTETPGILHVPEGDDANRLVRKAGPPLGERPTDAVQFLLKDQHEDEDSHGALTSLLDAFRSLHTSKPPNPTGETGESTSSTRFSPQDRFVRQAASSGSRTSNPQSLDSSRRSFSISTPGVPKRHFATATSQTVQADAQIDPPILRMNPDDLLKGKSGGIREALKLWQEQHDNVLSDTSGRPGSTTLSETQNLFTQSGEDESFTAITRDDEMEEDDDDVDFGSDEPIPDIFAHQVFLRRGDLVELLAASEVILAIFVRNVADQCQFYTIRGEWVHREPRGARWAVSRFVDPDDLNEILPYLPTDEVVEEKMNHLQPIDVHAPRGAGAKIIEQMSRFHQAADAVFREHADRINRLYEIIAPSRIFADRTSMSLKAIAMKVLMKEDPSELTQPMMWAIHRAIAQCQNISWDLMNYRQNPMYEVFPRQGLKDIVQVREWVREYQEGITLDTTNESMSGNDSTLMAATRSLNPIAAFVKKARVAIQQSRQTRPLSRSGSIGPSSTRIDIDENLGKAYREIHMEKFDRNERAIIHYLDVWTMSSYLNPYTNLASSGPMILRAVGMYEGLELDEYIGFTLLQELGVVTPWENRIIYKIRNMKLPKHERVVETTAFEPKDAMEGLRKDWGDMPVFCIDSADTEERDDGVSLELIDNDPSAYWVHVHVANPSAFITPDSTMAKYAASLAESVYLPERKYSMLNTKMTKDHLSLANDRPCITFTAKVSVDGETLEKKITSGIVRNVHHLTPRMVGQGLGLIETDEESDTVSMLTVGGRMPTQPRDNSNQTDTALTDPEHIKVLRKLLELGEAARHKRAQAGAPDFYSSARIATTYPVVYLSKSPSKHFKIRDDNVRQFEGDPIITLQRTTETFGTVAKMVSDLMIIAGDVAASWCASRNIPIPYRGILRNPEPASPPAVFKRDVLDPKIARDGHAGQSDLLRYMRLVGQAQASDRPLEHPTLGLPAYCKATSPLRRHIDLYAHWQIEAAMRHEAATGTSLVVGRGTTTDERHETDESYLPFSRAAVEAYAGGAMHREKKISLAKNASTRHWICQALFRAFHFGEARLPASFAVTVIDGSRLCHGYHAGWLREWGVKVQLRDGAVVRDGGGWRVGDVWVARLERVDTYRKNVYLVPVRLAMREGEGKRGVV